MLRFFARFIGLWIWAGAVVAAVYDGTRSLAASEFVFTPLGRTWYALHPDSLNGLQVAIERHLAEYLYAQVGPWAADFAYFLWNPVMQSILLAPTWLVLGVIGLFFLFIGRQKQQRLSRVPAHA